MKQPKDKIFRLRTVRKCKSTLSRRTFFLTIIKSLLGSLLAAGSARANRLRDKSTPVISDGNLIEVQGTQPPTPKPNQTTDKALPSWVPAPGHKADIQLNKLWQVDYAPSATRTNRGREWYTYGDGQDGRFIEWSGAVYAKDYSQNGAMIYFGGGHSGSQYTKLAIFDLTTRLWAEKGEQTRYAGPYKGIYPSGFTTYLGHTPNAEHTYANTVYVPASVAGNKRGWWLYAVAWGTSGWGVDLDHIDDADGGKFRLTTGLGPQPSGAYGGACFDSNRNRVWAIFSGNAQSNKLHYIDISPATKKAPAEWQSVTTGFWSRPNYHNILTYIPEKDCLISFSPGFSQSNKHVGFSASVLNLDNSSTQKDWTAWSPSMVNAPPANAGNACSSFEWCPLTGKFYAYPGFNFHTSFSRNPNCVDYVHAGTPSGWSSGATWTWATENFIGPATPLVPPLFGDAIPSGQVPITRFRWNPVLKSFMWATHRDGPVQLWRPRGA